MLIWFRLKTYYPYGKKKPKGAVLISANHISYRDPVTMFVAFPFRRPNCLATKELFDTKIKRAFFTRMHCIEVDRDNFTVSAFHDVVERLKDGRAVVIFPEGRLNREEEDLLSFKSGAVLMAHKADAPILPVYICKVNKWYQRQRIVIGEPFDVRAQLGAIPTIEKITAVSEALREKEIELRKYFESLPVYKKIAKKPKSEGEKSDE